MNPVYGTILARPDAVNIAHVVERCRVLGPGERFVIWVQGCPLRCPGCHNPQFLAFRDATWVDVGDLAGRVKTLQGIEGVTFVGGEPFAQARALAALAARLRDSGLSVMAYSGFTLDQLLAAVVPDAVALLDTADLLMDGPYLRGRATHKPWRGSDNQQLIALSDRYGAEVRGWNQPTGQSFEMRVAPDGTLEVLGIPPLDLVASLPTRVSAATETRPLVSQMSDTFPGKIAGRTDGEETENNLFKEGTIP